MLDLVSQVRDVILMNVYLDLGDPGALWAVSETRLPEEALTVSAKYTTFNSTFWQDGHIFRSSPYYKIVF